MGYSVNFNGLRNCIDVFHIGSLSLSELSSSIPEVQRICLSNNCWKIVSDIRQAQYQLKDTEEFVGAQHLGEAFPEHTRILILHNNQVPLESIRLLEQTLARHNIALKITGAENQGFGWLSS